MTPTGSGRGVRELLLIAQSSAHERGRLGAWFSSRAGVLVRLQRRSQPGLLL